MGQGRAAPVPVLAAQGGHRRRRGRVRGGVPHHARGIRPAVRQVPEGPLQAVPRQGAAGRLRPQPRARSARRRAFTNAYSVEPSPSGDLLADRHRQPAGPRDRHRPRLVEGRLGHPQPDQRLRPGQGLRVHRPARHAVQHGAVDVVVADRRPPRLLRRAREKSRTLILQNVLNAQRRAADRHADGGRSRVARHLARRPAASRSRRCRAASATSSSSTCRSGEVTNVTKDNFADSGPDLVAGRPLASSTSRASAATRSCSGSTSRPAQKTQLTFGTHDDSAAQFLDADTLVFSSTATDPAQPIEPDVARNGNIYNIWTLSLKNGELRQYTDALGGNIVDRRAAQNGDHQAADRVRQLLQGRVRAARARPARPDRHGGVGRLRLARADHRLPGAAVAHAGRPRTSGARARSRSCSSTAGRRSNVGVTSGGDVFGGSAVIVQRRARRQAVQPLRGVDLAVPHAVVLVRQPVAAVQLRAAGLSRRRSSSTAQLEGVFYDPAFSGLIDRDFAVATRTVRGGSAFGIWPLDRYRRLELFGGVLQVPARSSTTRRSSSSPRSTRQEQFGRQLFRNGTFVPLGVDLRAGDDGLPRVRAAGRQHDAPVVRGRAEDRQHAVAPDGGRRRALLPAARRLGPAGAARARLQELGRRAGLHVFRRQLRDARLRVPRSSSDQESAFFNAELRFPFIEAMLTPIGVLGGIRGVFFANMGGGRFEGQPFKWWSSSPRSTRRSSA